MRKKTSDVRSLSVGAGVKCRLSPVDPLHGGRSVPCEATAVPPVHDGMRRRLLQSGAGLALAGLCLPQQVLA